MNKTPERLSPQGIPVGRKGRYKRRERYNLLASWYGEERAAVEISTHTFQPMAIKDLVQEVMLEPGRGRATDADDTSPLLNRSFVAVRHSHR